MRSMRPGFQTSLIANGRAAGPDNQRFCAALRMTGKRSLSHWTSIPRLSRDFSVNGRYLITVSVGREFRQRQWQSRKHLF